MSALKHLRIIELAESVAGEYCAKLLADFGAEIIKIECPASGSPTRQMAPLVAADHGDRFSGLFAYLNTNKASLVLDPEQPDDRERLAGLIAEADAVVDDHPPRWLERWNLGVKRFPIDFPGVILASISPCGSEAAPGQWHAHSINIFHESGWGYHTPTAPDPDKPPLKGPGRFLVDYEAGLETALCIVSSLHGRQHNGDNNGCRIDISRRDVMISRADLVLGRILLGADQPGHHRTAYDQPGPSAFFPCRDGAVYLYVTNQNHWRGLWELMEQPRWMSDYDENWLEFGVTPELVAKFREHFGTWVKDKNKVEVSDRAQHLGVPLVPVNNAKDIQQSPQYRHREFFKPLHHPGMGPILYPTVPYRLSKTPASLEKPAPALDSHKGVGGRRNPPQTGSPNPPRPSPRVNTSRGGPLVGVRVVEITKVWAGPFAGKLLAMLGAEVIKVESHTNLDELRAFGGVDIDNAPFYLSVNQEILSVQANMKTDEGLNYVRDLIARSDIVIDNLRPGAMERLDLDYSNLRRVKEDIIHVSIKMFGNDGPLGHQTGYAPCFSALGGLSDLVGYEADNPRGINMRYGDSSVGSNAAFAAIVALLHREMTGEGQFVDVSAVECMSAMVGDVLLEYSLTGNLPVAAGNRHPEMAPHGCYPCRENEWISIAVDSDEAWQQLCSIAGDRALADDPRFNTLAKRQSNCRELDQRLSTLTSGHTASLLAERLLEAGVGAAKSMSTLDLMGNQALWQREIFRFVEDEKGDSRPVVGTGWKLPDNPAVIKRGAPLLGEHNDYVYGRILGLSAEEIEDLKERQVIY